MIVLSLEVDLSDYQLRVSLFTHNIEIYFLLKEKECSVAFLFCTKQTKKDKANLI